MLLFIVFIFSNCEPVGVFQYISCYCLSYTTSLSELYSGISIHLMLLFILFETFFSSIPLKFQYISCYCLSSCRWFCSWLSNYFNTSHVTVYLWLSLIRHRTQRDFNTSHVTVYHWSGLYPCLMITISIHLMLLFIEYSKKMLDGVNGISIHLMLLFIQVNVKVIKKT